MQLQSAVGNTYAIERELGDGGMSRVFLATETALDRPVVLKLLPPELASGVPTSQLYVAGVHPSSPLRFDPPRMVAPTRFANLDGRPYAPFPDWQRFVVKMPSAEHSARSIRLSLPGGGRPEEQR